MRSRSECSGLTRRFMQQPRGEVEASHAAQKKGLDEELTSLAKKVGGLAYSRPRSGYARPLAWAASWPPRHVFDGMTQMHERETDAQSKYLEKQFDEANSQLKDIVRWKDCHLDADHLLTASSTVNDDNRSRPRREACATIGSGRQ